MPIVFRLLLLISILLMPLHSFGYQNVFFKKACACKALINCYCISAGNKKFTYYKIAESLREMVAPDAGLTLMVMEGGSVENIKRIRWQRKVKFAIVQSDVLEFYKAKAEAGSAIAEKMIKPLRVVMPLYNEEVHFLVRKNSNINSFSDLKGKTIALGKPGGGSAITGKGLYKYMFGQSLPNDKAYYTPEGKDTAEDALKALVIDKTVDAWIMVVGQGTKQFQGMTKNANELIKLVKFDARSDTEQKILSGPLL